MENLEKLENLIRQSEIERILTYIWKESLLEYKQKELFNSLINKYSKELK